MPTQNIVERSTDGGATFALAPTTAIDEPSLPAGCQLGEKQGTVIGKTHAPTWRWTRVKTRLEASGRSPAPGNANNTISPRITPGLLQQGSPIRVAG